MPIDVPVLNAEGQNDGLDFVNVLRDCLSSAVIMLDERQAITAFNAQAELITGVRAAQALGPGAHLLPPALQQLIRELFSKGEAINDRRLIFHDKKHGESVIQANGIVARAGGKIMSVVIVLNDVSSIRKWEFNMRRLDRLHSVGTLSASMTHEIKNAFVAVRTFVDLLMEKNRDSELVDVVRREMSRIDSMVVQLLRFSGPAKPALSSVRLHFVLDKSALLIQHLMSEKKIKLTRSYQAASDLMEGDQDQLEQAFLNLFFNALDAMDENGHLDVSTELLPAGTKIEGLAMAENKRFLRLTVRDSGSGISAENMEHLFEPFFTTKPEGTGLGLAITRRIIQEHQGSISVQSEPNRGTSFTIVFPAENA